MLSDKVWTTALCLFCIVTEVAETPSWENLIVIVLQKQNVGLLIDMIENCCYLERSARKETYNCTFACSKEKLNIIVLLPWMFCTCHSYVNEEIQAYTSRYKQINNYVDKRYVSNWSKGLSVSVYCQLELSVPALFYNNQDLVSERLSQSLCCAVLRCMSWHLLFNKTSYSLVPG